MKKCYIKVGLAPTHDGLTTPPPQLKIDEGPAQLKLVPPNLRMVTRSISSIYRFIVMLVADITDVR